MSNILNPATMGSGSLTTNPSGTVTINWIQQCDPTNWNTPAQPDPNWPLRVEECQSEMTFGGGRSTAGMFFTSPPPNFIRRLIWKWALGVTWKDLRPEHDLETLKKLK